jgi:hypothetical protein
MFICNLLIGHESPRNRNMPTTKSIESKQFAHRPYTVPLMCKRFASAKFGRELQLAEIEDHFRLVSGFTVRPGPGCFEAISFVYR